MTKIKTILPAPEELYQKVWDKYRSKYERNPRLTLSAFLTSESVYKKGFKGWMESNGLSILKSKQRVRKTHEEEIQTNLTMKKGGENKTSISDSDNMIFSKTDTVNTDTKQYWWLNVDATIWELDKANTNETKTINCDVQFIEWISNYLIDEKHIGIPIAQRELAVSLLDYCHITVDKMAIKGAYKRIRDNLDDYIKTSIYVVDPPVVLLTPTDRENGYRQCAAWQYPKASDGYTIATVDKGNRLRRELKMSKRVYYFYFKSRVPHHHYDKSGAHDGDPDYVQGPPKVDPENNNHPNISEIHPITLAPSVKIGDSIIACMKNKIVAFIDVVSYNGKEIKLRIRKKLSIPILISSLKTSDCNFTPEKNLGFFPITESDFNCILRIIGKFMKYSIEDLLNEAYIDEKTIDGIVHSLSYKKNIILQGVPGVGKTYLATKLAYAMIGCKDEERVCVVQFHPNYTYEDFIIGYKPCDDGKFQLKPGVFMEFCKKATEDKEDNKYFFIIDEINRANLSKVFGEAFTLIDKDHRRECIQLAGSDDVYKEFVIPENIYIIGLMNTADRSLAMLDYALMRRFEFLPLEPAFTTKSFKKYQDSLNSDDFNTVIDKIIEINEMIAKNSALGEGFCIGHSYFCISKERNKKEYKECKDDIKTWLKNVINYEIIPILRAYCFDDEGTFDKLSEPLRNIFDDKR